jgi:bifunctional NMN adenylyltransferase/nudix hydrolase
MLAESYPNLNYISLRDYESDTYWSAALDQIIMNKCGVDATLYGGRDSFIPYYSGHYPTVRLMSFDSISATEMRRACRLTTKSSAIEAAIVHHERRYPIVYTTADIIVRRDEFVLGIKKEGMDGYVFPGGFFDTTKDRTTEDTALRELQEEVGMMEVRKPFLYRGQQRIDDWRLRGTKDIILTNVYYTSYIYGSVLAGDDAESADWILPIKENFNKQHWSLLNFI